MSQLWLFLAFHMKGFWGAVLSLGRKLTVLFAWKRDYLGSWGLVCDLVGFGEPLFTRYAFCLRMLRKNKYCFEQPWCHC